MTYIPWTDIHCALVSQNLMLVLAFFVVAVAENCSSNVNHLIRLLNVPVEAFMIVN